MTAKEYLLELSEMREDIQLEKELRQEYLDMATSISAPINEIRVQTSRSDNGKVERYGTLAADIAMKIEQNNTNNISSGDDIDGFMTKLTDSVNEAVDNMTEGVHD